MGSFSEKVSLLDNDTATIGFMSFEAAPYLPRLSAWITALTAIIAVCLAQVTVWARRSPPANIPPRVTDHYPLIGSWGFWSDRWPWWQRARAASATGNFSFYVGSNLVVGVNGEASRKWFFETKQLGVAEGYRMLLGTAPSTTVRDSDGNDTWHTIAFQDYFINRLVRLLRHDHIQKCFPFLVADVQTRLKELKDAPVPITDPFETIYSIVYQLIVRTLGCVELAEDRALLQRVIGWYDTMLFTSTFMPVVFPWFPSINAVRRWICGAQVYIVLNRIVKGRRSGKRESDALQSLVDGGDADSNLVAMLMGAIFTASTNSNVNVCWMLIFLTQRTDWKQKLLAEIKAVADKYVPDKEISLAERLARLPLHAWETEFPMLEVCSRDGIRLNTAGANFRQNTSDTDLTLPSGEVIPAKAYVAYHVGDIHYDPEVYPDPHTWDPDRYAPGQDQSKRVTNAYTGWGAGRHPCAGMKFAILEQTIVLALFLATFDEFSICDAKGNPIPAPKPQLHYTPLKPVNEVFLKYHARE